VAQIMVSSNHAGQTGTGRSYEICEKKIMYTNMKERLGIPSNVIASRHNWENGHGRRRKNS